ncbi:MAG TPA: hypothetical protein VJB35_05910 [Candidatus Nanoarchaeia archaeon]|nr:hypothetical protein [Candidatus Nanoarchaeia archaeon]
MNDKRLEKILSELEKIENIKIKKREHIIEIQENKQPLVIVYPILECFTWKSNKLTKNGNYLLKGLNDLHYQKISD